MSHKCEKKKSKCSKEKCCVNTKLSLAKFEEDRSNPIRGKNVLIIGASNGIGLGAAKVFIDAGAIVVGTSRKPSDYPLLGHLSPVPLDIGVEASVSNFFKTSVINTWTKIDILILGGRYRATGLLAYSKGADIFGPINVELIGRQRVVSHAIQKMYQVDDSRIINLSSAFGMYGLYLNNMSYGQVSAAGPAWCKQFNFEAEWLKKLNGGVEHIKTRAISFQGSFIKCVIGDYPETLCPRPNIPCILTGQFSSGNLAPYTLALNAANALVEDNSFNQNLTQIQAGLALLYMVTVRNPNWQYIVISPDETLCSTGSTTECLFRRVNSHKDAKKVLLEVNEATNYLGAYNNILNGNSERYSFYKCPPKGATGPNVPMPEFRPCYPDCEGEGEEAILSARCVGFEDTDFCAMFPESCGIPSLTDLLAKLDGNGCGPDPTPAIYNWTQQKNVDDLVNNPCHTNSFCPP